MSWALAVKVIYKICNFWKCCMPLIFTIIKQVYKKKLAIGKQNAIKNTTSYRDNFGLYYYMFQIFIMIQQLIIFTWSPPNSCFLYHHTSDSIYLVNPLWISYPRGSYQSVLCFSQISFWFCFILFLLLHISTKPYCICLSQFILFSIMPSSY